MLQDAGWPVTVALETPRGRILVMDSMGYVDARCDVSDVLVCGSHTAVCAAGLTARARPRGVIGHDGGMGKDRNGVSGLRYWQRLRIPGAAVEASSARVGDGLDIWQRGKLAAVNGLAASMGLRVGMGVQEASRLLLEQAQPMRPTPRIQHVMEDGSEGKIIGIDTVIYCDERMDDSVMVMAGHCGVAFATYIFTLPFRLRGVVNIDGGASADGSGVSGIPVFDAHGMPIAACAVDSCRIGDTRDVWASGVISVVGEAARRIGVKPGMSAREAAVLMLRSGT